MADNAWCVLHTLDEVRGVVVPMIHAESDLSEIREFVPATPEDYRIALGIKSHIFQVNGSEHFITETMADLIALLKAKSI